jgi:hypothetical protein
MPGGESLEVEGLEPGFGDRGLWFMDRETGVQGSWTGVDGARIMDHGTKYGVT